MEKSCAYVENGQFVCGKKIAPSRIQSSFCPKHHISNRRSKFRYASGRRLANNRSHINKILDQEKIIKEYEGITDVLIKANNDKDIIIKKYEDMITFCVRLICNINLMLSPLFSNGYLMYQK